MSRCAGTLPAMTKRLALASFLLCLLAACGNKGPLVMAESRPADAPAPATQPAAEPAATESGTPAR